ncbi:MAG: hypothetical protein EU540_07685 [Promethearchaeota archaeon]|nr:MAG: hypothetical protein EU540_07685 [Candidatus Lokiarchaeota archaeon]
MCLKHPAFVSDYPVRPEVNRAVACSILCLISEHNENHARGAFLLFFLKLKIQRNYLNKKRNKFQIEENEIFIKY